MGCTALMSLLLYFLEHSSWAESVRQMIAFQPSEEPRQPPAYGVMLAMSLAKATVMIGAPLLVTLALNRVRLWLLSKKHSLMAFF